MKNVWAVWVGASLALTGCATGYTLSRDRVEGLMYEDPTAPRAVPRVYAGVVVDANCVKGMFETGREAGQAGVFCVIDVPLSLVADTLLLPYTIYDQIAHGTMRPRFVPWVHDWYSEQTKGWTRKPDASPDAGAGDRRDAGPPRG